MQINMPTCVLESQGTAVYAPEKDALVWKIKNFPGGREFLLRCKFGLPSVAAEEEPQGRLPPIKVKFEIPYYSVRCAVQCAIALSCLRRARPVLPVWKALRLGLAVPALVPLIAPSVSAPWLHLPGST